MSVKILIGCCVIDYNPSFVESLVGIVNTWDTTDGELVFYPRWRTMIHHGQKECVEKAINLDCSHVLFIEDDTTHIPENALQTLLKHDKDVIGGFAYSRHFPYAPCAYQKVNGETGKWTDKDPIMAVLMNPDEGIKEVSMLSFQFMLVKTSVFSRISKPWFFYIEERGATDIWFADRCNDANIKMWCDTDMIIQHAGIDGKNAGFYMQKELLASFAKSNWTPDCILPAYDIMGISVTSENRNKGTII